jgi:glycosidase
MYTGYHGYWPTNLDQVEERLGSLELLKELVKEAHQRDIKVVMDYVMNHVHENSPVYQNYKDWFWSFIFNGKDCVCGHGCSWDISPENKRCWFMSYLPDFNFANAASRQFSVDNAIQWVQKTGVDGFRLDAVKHIEFSWLTDLRQAIQSRVVKGNQRFYLVGETFSYDKGMLKDFINPTTMLDGQFDFPLRAQLVNTILMRQGNFWELDDFLRGNHGYYGPRAIMGTFIGNHDLPRAINLAEDTPQFSAMDSGKARSWYNLPSQPNYDKPYQRLGVAFAALMTLPGIPLIYYGDEIGLAGGGDPDNRRFMQWSGYNEHQLALSKQVSKLAKIRLAHKALRYGTPKEQFKSANVYAYSMNYQNDQLVVILNRSDSAQTLSLSHLPKASYQDLLTQQAIKNAALVTIAPRSSMILQ